MHNLFFTRFGIYILRKKWTPVWRLSPPVPPSVSCSRVSATELCLSGITKFCTREGRVKAMRELGLRANVHKDGDRDASHQRRAGQSVSLRCELCSITCARNTRFHSTSQRCYLISSLHTSRSPSHEILRSVIWKITYLTCQVAEPANISCSG